MGDSKEGHLGAQKNEQDCALRSVGTHVHHPEGFESCLELWMSFLKCNLYVFYLRVCAWCPRSPEDAGTGVTFGCELLCGFWGLNLGPLHEQQQLSCLSNAFEIGSQSWFSRKAV